MKKKQPRNCRSHESTIDQLSKVLPLNVPANLYGTRPKPKAACDPNSLDKLLEDIGDEFSGMGDLASRLVEGAGVVCDVPCIPNQRREPSVELEFRECEIWGSPGGLDPPQVFP
jgi:hypothetical protein